MTVLVLLLFCVPVGVAIYFGIVRPFLIPIEWRISTGKAYRPSFCKTVK